METNCIVESHTLVRCIVSLHLYWMLQGNKKCDILRMSSWICQLNSVSSDVCLQEIEEADFISDFYFLCCCCAFVFVVWVCLFVWLWRFFGF